MSKPSKEEIRGAFTALRLAIEEALRSEHYDSQTLWERAMAYGQRSTPEAIRLVGDWFDWEKITAYLRTDREP